MRRIHEEYGGFLPLELNPGKEYYNESEYQMVRFNCAKAAISFLLKQLDISTVHVPYYLCPNVCDEIENHNMTVKYYHIDKNLLPKQLECHQKQAVYLVDYFGIIGHSLSSLIRELALHYTVIIDSCHSFFRRPVDSNNVYNIYSAKKFFGVPDGAYLISSVDLGTPPIETIANSYASYLLSCFEEGTNVCYSAKKSADQFIARYYGGMSVLAKGLLQNVDYERVKRVRTENFRQYDEAFGRINQIPIMSDNSPYMYPLYFGEKGNLIKHHLVKEKIYVPSLWNGKNLLENGNEFELSLAQNALFLPVDQRYNKKDIEFIIERVRGSLNGVA